MAPQSIIRIALPLVAALLLSGCLARAAVDVVTLPVKVASAGVDAVTTSRSEADEKRGATIRERQDRIVKLKRDYRKISKRCRKKNDERTCDEAKDIAAEIEDLEFLVGRGLPYTY